MVCLEFLEFWNWNIVCLVLECLVVEFLEFLELGDAVFSVGILGFFGIETVT